MSQPQSFYQPEDTGTKHGGNILPSNLKNSGRVRKTQAPQTVPQTSQVPQAFQIPRALPQVYQTPPRPIPQMSMQPLDKDMGPQFSQRFQDDEISIESNRNQAASKTSFEKTNSLPKQRPDTVHVAIQPLEYPESLESIRRRGAAIRGAPRTPQAGILNRFRIQRGITIPYKSGTYFHRDPMGRKYNGPEEECYNSEKNHRLKPLVVQAADDFYNSEQRQTWKRTYVRNVGPFMLRLAYWPFKVVESDKLFNWSPLTWGILVLRWILACMGLFFAMLWFPSNSAFREGMYNPFPYRLREYPKASRNLKEDYDPDRVVEFDSMNSDIKHQRLLRPHKLCYLMNPESSELHGIDDVLTEKEWSEERSIREMNLPYLFVSFTSEHFRLNQEDVDALHQIAEKATRKAKLPAYWLSYTCMSTEKAALEQDVFRINDVIRGASAVVIALGHPQFSGRTEDENALLRTWGKRVWTLPEALLCTRSQDLEIYIRGTDLDKPRILSKTEIARIAWPDSDVARQLINHYDGSLVLSRLELVLIAIKCLRARDKGKNYLSGDLPYALMGLLRRRPRVNAKDTEFQALARLSLANDSDRLLERMICALPKWGNDWLTADDSWNANLWDIYPACQVSAIGHGDTVVLDGCYAAAIRWKSFAFVETAIGGSWRRSIARFFLRISPWVTLILAIFLKPLLSVNSYMGMGMGMGMGMRGGGGGSSMLSYTGGVSTGQTTGIIILFVIFLTMVIMSPILVKVLYGGKFWDQQPWLFGFEGYMDIETIESQIFGYSMGRLRWSPAGSPLSRHRPNLYGECVGVDPTVYDEDVRETVERSKTAEFGKPRVFTIVDTYTMTVTLFEAVRPPVMVLLCGSEGGMQRAVMCSYEWKSQTLARESVLRMETPVLEKMWRIGRVKFGFNRSTAGTEEV